MSELNKPDIKEVFMRFLAYVGAIFLFLLGIACLFHPLLTLALGCAGCLLLPPTRKWLETRLPFELTSKRRNWSVGILILAFFCGAGKYAEKKKKTIFAGAKTEQVGSFEPRSHRRDSFKLYLEKADAYLKSQDTVFALLEKASLFAETEEDRTAIGSQKEKTVLFQARDHLKRKQYTDAIPLFSSVMQKHPDDTLLLFERGLCYAKNKQMEAAVADLRSAMKSGSKKADSLHEKINPIRRRFVGYETLCCDGSTSSARGQGACSHHQGVCDWNKPVYIHERRY